MDSGYYAAMTGLVARTQALDTAAANLANAQTPGYRAEREYFRSVLLGPGRRRFATGQNREQLRPAGRRPAEHGAGRAAADRAILWIWPFEGEGFFQMQTPNGLRYTRDGSFHRSQSGRLVTAAGEPVLSAAGQPIPVPPGEVAVGADGALSVAGGVVATVGVFTFPAGTELTPEGANRYVAPPGVISRRSKTRPIHQGALEAANRMGPGIARSGYHAAPGGDDAEGADRLPHRVQQDCDRGPARV